MLVITISFRVLLSLGLALTQHPTHRILLWIVVSNEHDHFRIGGHRGSDVPMPAPQPFPVRPLPLH